MALVTRRALLRAAGLGALALATAGRRAWSATETSTYIFGQPSEFDTLDPHLVFDVGRVASRINLYDSLLRWEDNPPKLHPWLAERYTVSPDGRRYTFFLRKGAKFHDGSEVTAEAVRYSMERQLALGKGAASLFKPVVEPGSTRVVDRYTVEFNLREPRATFLATIDALYIVNPAVLKAHEKDGDWGSTWLSSNEAGSGSYQLEAYNPAVGFTGRRFAEHWLGWSGRHVERIEFRTIREPASRVNALLRGDIHATDGYLPADLIDKLSRSPEVKIIEQESMRIFVIMMHNQRPPLNDVHVRRAISYAFDYDSFINNIMKGRVVRNPGPIPNNMWGAPRDLQGYTYDLEKAKEELAKASVKVDRPLEISPLVGYPVTQDAAVVLQSGLRKLGIELKIKPETWPTLVGKARQQETTPDLWVLWVSTYYADPANWINEMYDSANWGAWKASSWYKNPQVDALLREALRITDQAQRQKLYEKAARLIVEEAASLWIYNTKWYGPFRTNVQGVRFCPIGNGREARWIYLT
ncbi:MAG: ABC transporter substrate-binding protein [Candidatus Tectimicrobiota bacterium]|nr:MAG: ABC transporter substrate-binding protein [Candidatus Tectomicrobia bacterium]